MSLRLTLTLALVAGCGGRDHSTTSWPSGGDGSSSSFDPTGVTVETFASPLEVVAGNAFDVRCVVSREREHLPGFPTRLLADPDAGAVTTTASGFSIAPTRAGRYQLRCETA